MSALRPAAKSPPPAARASLTPQLALTSVDVEPFLGDQPLNTLVEYVAFLKALSGEGWQQVTAPATFPE